MSMGAGPSGNTDDAAANRAGSSGQQDGRAAEEVQQHHQERRNEPVEDGHVEEEEHRPAVPAELERGAPQQEDREQERPEQEPEGQARILWMELQEEEVKRWVEETYAEIVDWSPSNLFQPPNNGDTRYIISEMRKLIDAYVRGNPLAPHALKILMVMPHLFWQKTHTKSKPHENISAQKNRVEKWKIGQLDDILSEARALQVRLNRNTWRRGTEDKARIFGEQIRKGKVAPAVRSLTKEASKGLLPLTQETIAILKDKHPEPSEEEELRLAGEYVPPNRVIFEQITSELVWKMALKTQGSGGPSGLDADGWKTLLSKRTSGREAADLCQAVANLARKLATEDCQHLEAYTACRLIPLDKDPGCRPVGVGEVLRRIVGKCIMEVVKEDVRIAAGNLQVCAGHQAGGEAAIHAIREIYEQDECQGVMLVDASNAFNTLNRKTAIHNIKRKCPSFAPYVENTYRQPADLFIVSRDRMEKGEKIESREGTTQGDPIAMAMYALGLSVLQSKISYETTRVKQVAYADDLTGAGEIANLKKWWDEILVWGPKVGYNPNAIKSVLIVKADQYDRALEIFRDSGVVITKEGQRHLGAVIGTEEYKIKYVKEKVGEWIEEVEELAKISITEPQAAYAAFTHGVKHRWTYLMRTVPNVSPLLQPLETAIKDKFIPTFNNSNQPSQMERELLALPARLGGLGITDPAKMANIEHLNSTRITRSLTDKIIEQDAEGETDQADIYKIRATIAKEREDSQRVALEQLKGNMTSEQVRRNEIAQETGASNWLTALPIRAKGFNLNKQEFCDAIALRYGWPMNGLPDRCVCGMDNSTDHTMICKRGGFISIRHDEVRDLTANMLKEVCTDVCVEPELINLQGEILQHGTANRQDRARVDVSARGFWVRGQRAFFDVRIFDPMAPTYRGSTLDAAHKKNEQEKNRAYAERIIQVEQGSFTPLVFTTSGGMSPRAKCFYSRLAEVIAEKKQQPRSQVMAWIRCRLSFSLLRSALLCLRGTRVSGPKPTAVDGMDFQREVAEGRIGMD